MKVTKDDIMSIGLGKTKAFTLTPQKMLSARAYMHNLSLITNFKYRTSYDKKNQVLSITRIN